MDTRFADVATGFDFAMAHSYGGYTTNLALEESSTGRPGSPTNTTARNSLPSTAARRVSWCRISTSGARQWVQGLHLQSKDIPGFWDENGYDLHGDPWRDERYA